MLALAALQLLVGGRCCALVGAHHQSSAWACEQPLAEVPAAPAAAAAVAACLTRPLKAACSVGAPG